MTKEGIDEPTAKRLKTIADNIASRFLKKPESGIKEEVQGIFTKNIVMATQDANQSSCSSPSPPSSLSHEQVEERLISTAQKMNKKTDKATLMNLAVQIFRFNPLKAPQSEIESFKKWHEVETSRRKQFIDLPRLNPSLPATTAITHSLEAPYGG